jgi:carbon-monoxide dehydrogenase iron sulfur subunit
MTIEEKIISQKIHVVAMLCRDCQACTLVCSLRHEGECNAALARLIVLKDMRNYEYDIAICQHCEEPECVDACPSGAISLDERLVAIIDYDACTVCGICAEECPYDAIFYNEQQDRYLKCDLCADWGGFPLCVEFCPAGALTLIEKGKEA